MGYFIVLALVILVVWYVVHINKKVFIDETRYNWWDGKELRRMTTVEKDVLGEYVECGRCNRGHVYLVPSLGKDHKLYGACDCCGSKAWFERLEKLI